MRCVARRRDVRIRMEAPPRRSSGGAPVADSTAAASMSAPRAQALHPIKQPSRCCREGAAPSRQQRPFEATAAVYGEVLRSSASSPRSVQRPYRANRGLATIHSPGRWSSARTSFSAGSGRCRRRYARGMVRACAPPPSPRSRAGHARAGAQRGAVERRAHHPCRAAVTKIMKALRCAERLRCRGLEGPSGRRRAAGAEGPCGAGLLLGLCRASTFPGAGRVLPAPRRLLPGPAPVLVGGGGGFRGSCRSGRGSPRP
ncbi:hypothetical protein K373_03798 [Streptomyces sp. DvalAA-21]|nr:hypothetical protein SACTE_6254 [Streptomyces sp. SirexAA-E]PZX37661.1 hypothetical protein K373_03798 [Streptomyces sp. DvalAA-21]RAJ33646.1 hypothetical protein K351_03204 [Streptomyces sp. DpondAA-E10]RAJ48414.1 hypothetical protein K352_02938 [Streptomyces sp. DpondAA-A50]SCD43338.1 hypothetical protein GA0115235_102286 [Streptomyces sp. DpondAA-F4a]SCM07200.1 hypothetical protein SAMN04883147_107279 [Streptomyces sp. DpondAA-F4]